MVRGSSSIYLRSFEEHQSSSQSSSSLRSPSFICRLVFTFIISQSSCFSSTLPFYFSKLDSSSNFSTPDFQSFLGSWGGKSDECSSVLPGFKECVTPGLHCPLHSSCTSMRVFSVYLLFWDHFTFVKHVCSTNTSRYSGAPKSESMSGNA